MVWAIGTVPIGGPGCLELACCTPSADRNRMIFTARFWSSGESFIGFVFPVHFGALAFPLGMKVTVFVYSAVGMSAEIIALGLGQVCR